MSIKSCITILFIIVSISLNAQKSTLFEINYFEKKSIENKELGKTIFEIKDEKLNFIINDKTDSVSLGEYKIKLKYLEKLWEKPLEDSPNLIDKDSLLINYELDQKRGSAKLFLSFIENLSDSSKNYKSTIILGTEFLNILSLDNLIIDSFSISDFYIKSLEEFENLLFKHLKIENKEELKAFYNRDSLDQIIQSKLIRECSISKNYNSNPAIFVKWKEEGEKEWNSLKRILLGTDIIWKFKNSKNEKEYYIINKDLDQIVTSMLPKIFSKRDIILEFYTDKLNLIKLVADEIEQRSEIRKIKK